MLNTGEIGSQLKNLGYSFYSGVPCSYLKNLINHAINEHQFIMAANEGDAAAICAGAFLGGRKPVLLCQNSGLANAVSPLGSLQHIFKIPLLGFVSLRGEIGIKDEPQHELMGEITGGLLSLMKIKWDFLSPDPERAMEQIEAADSFMKKNESFFFVVKKDSFSEVEPAAETNTQSEIREKFLKEIRGSFNESLPGHSRFTALSSIIKHADESTVIIAATGKTGRELFEIKDHAGNFYMLGSMGCASSIALGIAITRPLSDVIAIDGDAALIMRMGALATNGYYGPKNMLHILLDNESHASTGGQFTVSPSVDFAQAALACNYKRTFRTFCVNELENIIKTWKNDKRLTFVHMKINKDERAGTGRPSIKPYEVKERLIKFLGRGGII